MPSGVAAHLGHAFDVVHVDEPETGQRVEVGPVGGHRVAIERGFARHGGAGRDADPDPLASAPNLGHGRNDVERKPQPVLQAATVAVGPFVGAVADELLQEVVVGRVDLDTVETRLLGASGGVPVIFDDGRDLVRLQRTRRDVVLQAGVGEGLALRRDGRGGDRKGAVVQARMGDAAGVPELEHHQAVPRVNGPGDPPPCLDLGGRPDAGRQRVAARLRRDVGRLRDDQPCRGALSVVFGREGGWHARIVGPASGQRRHDDPVLEGEVAQSERLEQRFGSRCRHVRNPCGVRRGSPSAFPRHVADPHHVPPRRRVEPRPR